MVHNTNRVCRNVTVRPCPLHDGVHSLPGAAGRFRLRQPDRAEHVCAVSRGDCIKLAVPQFGKDVGFERADPLSSMLFVLPARLEFLVNLSRRFLERECCCRDRGRFAFPVALVDRVFAAVDELPHGERLFASFGNRRFRVCAETGVSPLAGDRTSEAQGPFAARFGRCQQQSRDLSVEDRLVARLQCFCLFVG